MALSQVQCLDDNHINPRMHESKPEFFYCEEQRVALEALLDGGRDAFFQYLEKRDLRRFLSDPELDTLLRAAEPFEPGSEQLFVRGEDEDEPTPLSLRYWPELSDTSLPRMELGWPDCEAYRGVTRAAVYAQPPEEGQAHIKEVVRRMIAQAQKVIAVAMDEFTDVDIFRDLLDAAFRRRVSVYILLERSALPYFLSMCQRASMHAGHLKYLRVRCSEGEEFYTRSSRKVRGRMNHRFMFIDGDKALSGSYSFTWMSSRLDINLVTVVTGQAVEAFDHLFRFLYMTSSHVDLRQVTTAPEPEPDPRHELSSVKTTSAAVAKRLNTPIYALVALSSPTTSVGNNNVKENSKEESQRKVKEEAEKVAPPLHPGLANLEKACLMSYLPIWPEPDPPSDVIGFINIRDTNKPIQVHLQRSEMFETSQAIRFSSPFSKPQEDFPEVAKPRQLPAENEAITKLQQGQSKLKAEQLVEHGEQPAQECELENKDKGLEQKSPPCTQNFELDKDKTENKLNLNTDTNPDVGQSISCASAHTQPLSSSETRSVNCESPSHKAQNVSPTTGSSPGSNSDKKDKTVTNLKTQSAFVCRTHTLDSGSANTSQLSDPTASNTEETQETQETSTVSHKDSYTKPVNMQAEVASEMTHHLHTPSIDTLISTSVASAVHSEASTLLSKSNPIKTVPSSTATSPDTSLPSTPSPSSFLPPVASFDKVNLPLSSSSSFKPSFPTSAPPIPKPRTVLLVIKDGSVSNGHLPEEISVVGKPEANAGQQVVQSGPTVHTSPVEEPESASKLRDNSNYQTEDLKDSENTDNPKETNQVKHGMIVQEVMGEEVDGGRDCSSKAQSELQTWSDDVITAAPKTASVDFQKTIPKDVESKTLTSIDSIPETDCVAEAPTDTKNSEKVLAGCTVAKEPNGTGCQIYFARAHESQRISYGKLTSNKYVLESEKSIKDCIYNSSHNPYRSTDGADLNMFISGAETLRQDDKRQQLTDHMVNSGNHNTDSTSQEQTLKARGGTHAPGETICGHIPATRELAFNSLIPRQELPTPAVRTPSSDGVVSLPRPDSLAIPTDPEPHKPDLLTPTSDISDGYMSPRGESALSSTSEEYYECSNSPLLESIVDQRGYDNHAPHSKTPYATNSGTSPASVLNYSLDAATLDQDTSSSEGETLSATSGRSFTSLIEIVGQKSEPEEDTNENTGKAEEQNAADTESEVAQRVMERLKQYGAAAKSIKYKRPQAREIPAAAADGPGDGGVIAGEPNCQGTTPELLPAADLRQEMVSSERERPGRASSWREKTQLHKSVNTFTPKLQRRQQQDSGAPSSSQAPRFTRSLSASNFSEARPSGSRGLNQAESKGLHSSVTALDGATSPRRPASPRRPPPSGAAGPAGPATGRKQVSPSQQGLPQRPHAVPQIKARLGQPQSRTPYPKPPPSFLHTHSNRQPQVPPQSPTQVESAPEAHEEKGRRGSFGLTFSGFKGLKDKMSRIPTVSKRDSRCPPAKGRKSSS